MSADLPPFAPTATASPAADPDTFSVPVTQCLRSIFPTPLFVHEWPNSDDLNQALCDLIFAEEIKKPDGGKQTVGTWYTDHSFINRDQVPIRRLRQRALTLAQAATKGMMRPGDYRYIIDGWANVLRSGQYNDPHVHRRSVWSGVYYVTGNPPAVDGAPNPLLSGRIEFLDPRGGAFFADMPEGAMRRRALLDPPAGTMILFPSWLLHMVHPYYGPTPRVVVAFNLNVVPTERGKGGHAAKLVD
ncbi:MAG: TIGR02466 family protein [Pseudomonadota bacterium]